jgi:hypothetical protein
LEEMARSAGFVLGSEFSDWIIRATAEAYRSEAKKGGAR